MAAAIVLIMKTELERDLGGESPDLNKAHALLQEAMKEPVAQLSSDKVGKIVRRSKRIATSVLKSNFEKPLAIQYLIIAHWVMDKAEHGVICIGADSSFSQAWDIMAEVIGAVEDKFEEMTDEATAGAVMLDNALRQEGLFRA